ncbi:50S ribosomal protein L2 [Candidatus Uhrbacteria bacterium]|nr:50S ribosomal protein L2 [Candidatus Uhrbacteria bacterium]
MSVKRYKPTTAGRRISSVDDFSDITKTTPEKKLTIKRKKFSGRTNGKITVRHRGGGARRRIRLVDFKCDKFDVPAVVASIEYDPNRGARLALLHYADGEKRYIVAPIGLGVGNTVIASLQKGEIQTGNRFKLEHIPIGMEIYNIELKPGKGGQVVRGAGTFAQLMAIEGSYATLRLPSGEVRMVPKHCMATLGHVSNPDRRLIRWGKAGRTRHRGWRPTVRGKAMNPVDHPHGGGEGRNSIGLKRPKTPTGKPALGVKTRKKQASTKLIIQRRKRGRFIGGN